MYIQNIFLGNHVWVDPTSSVNNVRIGDDVVIGKKCTIFGRDGQLLEIGSHTRIGMYTILNGYSASLKIGSHCSIGPMCHFLTDSGPKASPRLIVKYPVVKAPITVGDHCHIGAACMVTIGVTIGDCSVIEPNSFVKHDVPPFSVYGGSPAKFIRKVEV